METGEQIEVKLSTEEILSRVNRSEC